MAAAAERKKDFNHPATIPAEQRLEEYGQILIQALNHFEQDLIEESQATEVINETLLELEAINKKNIAKPTA